MAAIQQLPQTSPSKALPLFFSRALADGWVRGVGCDDEGLDDDDDDEKSPDFGACLAVIITAGLRRPRAAALAAIAHLSSGV
jgi:hypothetical protein